MANINKPFVTVDDLNTALLMFKKGLNKPLIIDTSFIIEEDVEYEYEFLTIQKEKNNIDTLYSIRGGLLDSSIDPLVSVLNYSDAVIAYGMTYIDIFISNESTPPILSIVFQENLEKPRVQEPMPYFKDFIFSSFINQDLKILLYDVTGLPAVNTTLLVSTKKYSTEVIDEDLDDVISVTTDNNGFLNIPLSDLPVGKNDNFLYFYYEQEEDVWVGIGEIIVNLYPVLFDFKPSGNLFKDSLNDVAFDIFTLDGEDVDLEGAVLKIGNKEYTEFIIENEQLIFPDVDLYNFVDDVIYITLSLPDTTVQEQYEQRFAVECEYATFNDVITLTNPSPATALVEDGAYTVSAPIDLDNNLKLIFTNNAVLSDIIFNVYDDSTFELDGGVLENCNINLKDGILILNDMQVRESENPIVSEANTEININTSEFTDNIGEDIVSRGKLTVTNSKFLKQNVEDLNPLRPAFITVNGETTLNYNEFKILYGEITGTVGMAYVMFSINENAILNTNKGNMMKNNNTFNKQKNKGTINVEFNNKTINCEDNCFTWTVQGTNTVYHNNIRITEE